MKTTSKIVLIGNGAVGSTFAYTVLLRGFVNELVIIDSNRDKAEGDMLDLNHGLMLAQPMKITVGDYADCADADIVVITAGSAQRPGETRIDLMNRNVQIFDSIIKQITAYTTKAILLIATNPVDILTQVALKLSGFPKERVIGSGTLLDSSRFRYLVAEKLGVDPRSVHGMVIGEHGDSEVPVWSSLSVAGMLPETQPQDSVWHINESQKEEIYNETKGAAYKIIEKKGATFYAIALSLARICEAILKDQRSILPVSSYLEGYHGINGVCLGVPSIVGRNGLEEVVPLPLSEREEEQLQSSAAKLKQFLEEIGF
ncbi:L-lactate dehydrogenase [Aneurinibacillus terranovensis]|uniref:L-lactate dehydrogenase n=1 Tax=Aneurinibacillus terranovensis TaxID=278991 RepID=UPI0004130BB8|nr:L-lactate dehydrogenase [Aneurinibacillus terranovensis]